MLFLARDSNKFHHSCISKSHRNISILFEFLPFHMEAEFRIISIFRTHEKQVSREDQFKNNNLVLNIKMGNCLSSIDLNFIHFQGGMTAAPNYSLKVQNFDKNDEIIIYMNDNTHIIKPNVYRYPSIFIFRVGNIKFEFLYELKIQSNMLSPKSEPKKVLNNDENNYRSQPIQIEKQKVYSFLENRSNIETELPKVDF